MFKRIATPATLTAAMLAMTAITATPALAKGGQDNYERQQALEAEFSKPRSETTGKAATGLFDLLFGSDTDEDAGTKATKDKKGTCGTE